MQHAPQPRRDSLFDDYFVQRLVPSDHPLLEIDREVDFSFVRDLVGDVYSPDQGREAVDPELLLRLCFVQQYYGLSDRAVIGRAQTDLALRLFLHVGLEDALPHPSLLSVFRTRLGADRFQKIFNRSVAVAVERGLVEGRLLIVDSYGIVADVAIPRLRKLLMKVSRRGLQLLEKLGSETARLAGEHVALSEDNSWTQSKELREKDLKAWFILTGQVHDALASTQTVGKREQERRELVGVLAKALERQALPKKKKNEPRDTLVSDVDADARWSKRERGKKPFVGYKEQIATDVAHEIITAAQVTPANVDDTEPFETLVEQHLNNTGAGPMGVVADSGYSSGENRRKVKDTEATDYIAVPTPKGHKQGLFSASDFTPEFDDEGNAVRVRCPRGEVAEGGKWDDKTQGWDFYFTKAQCADCPLRGRCSKAKQGRTVFISRYYREHEDARARQDTPEFIAAQKERLGIERTFAYQQRRSGHKRARYRGGERMAVGVYACCFMVNVVRIATAYRRAQEGAARQLRSESRG